MNLWTNNKFRFLGISMVILLLLLGLFGCGKKQELSSNDQNRHQETEKQASGEPVKIALEEKQEVKPKLKAEEVKEAEKTPKSNSASTEEVFVDQDTSLSNEKHGWGFKRSDQHETPGFGSRTTTLINKYQGIFADSTDQKVVYLTLDEGYENGFTPRILDTLKDNQVKVAFFITGDYITRNPELVKRMVQEGHLVGNHSWTHPSLPDKSNEEIKEEITKLENAFLDLTGQHIAPYLRPPRGEYSERTLALTQELGYRTTFWSMAYRDWDRDNQPGAEYSYNHVMQNIHPGAVILLHAVSESNTQALDRIIKGLRNEGYVFKTLDELP